MMNHRTRVAHGRNNFTVFTLVLLLFLITGIGASAAMADEVVVPNAFEFVEGPTANCIPITGCNDTDRYQQVYDSSDFGSQTGIGPRFITEIRFRPSGHDNTSTPPFMEAIFTDIEINLSTTPALFGPDAVTAIGPDNLFTTFDTNTGGDVVNIYRGALTLSSAVTGPAAGPKDFDIVITLQTPFPYDPATGHLLLEWKNHGGETDFDGFPDAVNIPGDSTSRVEAASSASDPNAATGFADSVGLITQFTFRGETSETSARDVPTPTGEDITVLDIGAFQQVAAAVIVAGSTDADFCVAPDTREIVQNNGKGRYISRPLPLAELSGLGSCKGLLVPEETDTWEDLLSQIDLVIAPWYRSFEGDFEGESGTESGHWFVIGVVRTSAEYEGPVAVVGFPETLIDFTPDLECSNSNLAMRPLDLGGAVAAFGEFTNIEGKRLIVETAQCNRSSGLTRRTTHVFPVRLDGNARVERINVQWQLNGIEDTLTEISGCINETTPITSMQLELATARAAFAQGRFDDAIGDLEEIARIAKDADFTSCPIAANYSGNLMSRGLTGAFTIWDRFLHADSWEIYLIPFDLDVPVLTPTPIP